MCAMVACTASIGRSFSRIPAGGYPGGRVIHALLFLFAQVFMLVPGVCDACVKGCCERGMPRIADVASPVFQRPASPATAGDRDATECCQDASLAPMQAAERGEADGTAHCRCQLEPRCGWSAAVGTERSGRRDNASRWRSPRADGGDAVAWLSPPVRQSGGMPQLASVVAGGQAAIPIRPARVLYGIWRN